MRLFVCDDHDAHWAVPRASVAVAPSEAEARRLLDEALRKAGLKPSAQVPFSLRELRLDQPAAVVLADGAY
jgi:hypothetical protein